MRYFWYCKWHLRCWPISSSDSKPITTKFRAQSFLWWHCSQNTDPKASSLIPSSSSWQNCSTTCQTVGPTLKASIDSSQESSSPSLATSSLTSPTLSNRSLTTNSMSDTNRSHFKICSNRKNPWNLPYFIRFKKIPIKMVCTKNICPAWTRMILTIFAPLDRVICRSCYFTWYLSILPSSR